MAADRNKCCSERADCYSMQCPTKTHVRDPMNILGDHQCKGATCNTILAYDVDACCKPRATCLRFTCDAQNYFPRKDKNAADILCAGAHCHADPDLETCCYKIPPEEEKGMSDTAWVFIAFLLTIAFLGLLWFFKGENQNEKTMAGAQQSEMAYNRSRRDQD